MSTTVASSPAFTIKFAPPQLMYTEPAASKFPRKLHQRRLTVKADSPAGKVLETHMHEELMGLDQHELIDGLGDFLKVTVGRGKVYEADYDPSDQSIDNPQPVKLEQLFAKSEVRVLSLTAHGELYEASVDEQTGAEVYPAGVAFKVDTLLIERVNAVEAIDFGFTVKKHAKKARFDKPRRATPVAGKGPARPDYSVPPAKDSGQHPKSFTPFAGRQPKKSLNNAWGKVEIVDVDSEWSVETA